MQHTSKPSAVLHAIDIEHREEESDGFDVTRDDRGGIVVRIMPPPTVAADTLVRCPGPLERNAWRSLVASGALRVVKLGRFEYARSSDLVALVEKLGATRAPKPKLAKAGADDDVLGDLAARVRRGSR